MVYLFSNRCRITLRMRGRREEEGLVEEEEGGEGLVRLSK